MKALSLTQPWATLVAIGAKKIETRSWFTTYRGQIVIHAAKGFPKWARDYANSLQFQEELAPFGYTSSTQLPLGAIIAVAELAGCHSTDKEKLLIPHPGTRESIFGDYSENRFMWMLKNVRMLNEPIPCKGSLGLWEVPQDILSKIPSSVLSSHP